MARAGVTSLDPGPQPDPAKVALGRNLFFDPELSGNRDIACVTCHLPQQASSDRLSLSIGTGGSGFGPERALGAGRRFHDRNSQELFDRGSPGWRTAFWDGRVAAVGPTGFATPAGDLLPAGVDSVFAAQAMFPPAARTEMRGEAGDLDVLGAVNELALIDDGDTPDFPAIWSALMVRLLRIPEYVDEFGAAYPDVAPGELGFQHAGNAIAAFEFEAFTFLDSPWDEYLAGHNEAMSVQAKRGALLFYGEATCVACHTGNLMTDQEFHCLAVPQLGPGGGPEAPWDLGRARITGDQSDRFAFRTPPLRNVAATGPWMHDGAFMALADAVRHVLDPETSLRGYDPTPLGPGLRDMVIDSEVLSAEMLGSLDPLIAQQRPLSPAEVDELMAFLEALTSPSLSRLHEAIPDSVPSGLPVPVGD